MRSVSFVEVVSLGARRTGRRGDGVEEADEERKRGEEEFVVLGGEEGMAVSDGRSQDAWYLYQRGYIFSNQSVAD